MPGATAEAAGPPAESPAMRRPCRPNRASSGSHTLSSVSADLRRGRRTGNTRGAEGIDPALPAILWWATRDPNPPTSSVQRTAPALPQVYHNALTCGFSDERTRLLPRCCRLRCRMWAVCRLRCRCESSHARARGRLVGVLVECYRKGQETGLQDTGGALCRRQVGGRGITLGGAVRT